MTKLIRRTSEGCDALTLGHHNLLPFWRTTTVSSQKDFCLYRLYLFQISHSTTFFFFRPMARILQCLLALSVDFKLRHTHSTSCHDFGLSSTQDDSLAFTQSFLPSILHHITNTTIAHWNHLLHISMFQVTRHGFSWFSICLLLSLLSITLGEWLIALNLNLWALMPLLLSMRLRLILHFENSMLAFCLASSLWWWRRKS